MRSNRFQNKVATSNFTLPVAAFLTTLLWCAEGIYTLDRLLGWCVCGLTAYFWVETNNAHSLIRIRSRLTPSIYLWMTGCIFCLLPAVQILSANGSRKPDFPFISLSRHRQLVFPATAFLRPVLSLVHRRLPPFADVAYVLGGHDGFDSPLLVHGRILPLYGRLRPVHRTFPGTYPFPTDIL